MVTKLCVYKKYHFNKLVSSVSNGKKYINYSTKQSVAQLKLWQKSGKCFMVKNVYKALSCIADRQWQEEVISHKKERVENEMVVKW